MLATKQIHAESLTTFEVDPEGMYVRLHLHDGTGQPATLVLPIHCLNQLLMSAPRMIQTAAENRHGDDSLRLVFPLDDFNVELGEANKAGAEQFVLTLATSGGFAVSFSASQQQLASLGTAIVDDVQQREPLPLTALRYS